ncbi:MAG: S-adenosylmethionine decarboxylase proenzyme [Deltaproteobacteria bacterium]|nr:MAG: S-adenosylmethionine decarboxylase proenzyme [Deltaproteobacteria bacterium]
MKTLGRHLLAELYGCDEGILNNREAIEKIMNDAALVSGATIVGSVFHLFNPHGISGVVVIAESHFAIHTWPEFRYAAVDIFTCGDEVDPWKAHEHIKRELKAESFSMVEMRRGELDPQDGSLFPKSPVVLTDSGLLRV